MFELLFVLLVLVLVATLVVAAVTALRGRRRRALALLGRVAIGVAIYLGIVVVVALIAPQRVFAVGEDRCFDDWCLAVRDVAIRPELGEGAGVVRAEGRFYVVTLRLSNHARGRSQRASSAAVRLIDGEGRTYEVSSRGQSAFEAEHGAAPPLTSTLGLGESLDTVRVFDLPADARDVGLTVEHPVGFAPGLFIIGDDASLFHRPTIVRLR